MRRKKQKMVLLTIPNAFGEGFNLATCIKCGRATTTDTTGMCFSCAIESNEKLKKLVLEYQRKMKEESGG